MPKAVRAMEMGADLFIFPEGVWNKSPNDLLIDFWPGVYRIAKETGADIIPMVHYVTDPSKKTKDNIIHTVVDDPISISHLTEEEALELLKEKMNYDYGSYLADPYDHRRIELGQHRSVSV